MAVGYELLFLVSSSNATNNAERIVGIFLKKMVAASNSYSEKNSICQEIHGASGST